MISCLVSGWIEKTSTLKALNINVKNENRPSLDEKPTKLLNKKLHFLIAMLLMLGEPLSIDELMILWEYKDKGKFRQNYLKPLETTGLIRKTKPDKPTASNQKYLITEQGKRFLIAKND